MRLTPQQWHEIFRKITYKSGTRIDIEFDFSTDNGTIIIMLPVIDVNTGQATKVGTQYVVTREEQFYDEAQILGLVFRLVAGLETHEVKEWLKFEGIPFVEPHPELLPAPARTRSPAWLWIAGLFKR